MAVDRCVCRGVEFELVRQLAQRDGLDLAGVIDRLGCGTACGMCVPYLEIVLRTGMTKLPVMGTRDFARLATQSAR